LKRIVFASVLLIVAAMIAVPLSRDPTYWTRRIMRTLFDPANLPAEYYEPTQTLVGSNEPDPPRVPPQDEQLNPEALKAAAEYADKHPTTALIVGRHGHIVFEKYWHGATFDTVVDGGAFSATVTALAVGIAIGDRKIALVSEPVGNYIESFRDPSRSSITLEHLLQMRSGLSKGEWHMDPWNISSREQLVRDIRSECLSLPFLNPPGHAQDLKACDPQLLAHIIERTTGQAYASYVSERLWKPIGAADAHLMLDRAGGMPHASCCLRARLGDWMRIAELLVNDGKFQGEQIVPAGWVRNMVAAAKDYRGFGYQVWSDEPFIPWSGTSELYAAKTIVLKGFGKTRLWVVPSLGLTILRAGKNPDVDTQWDDSRIPNLIIRGARDSVPNGGAQAGSSLVPNH
jgi:CubicO group peptidase (beta-lactamase class C family)